jgi:hypothetical protein
MNNPTYGFHEAATALALLLGLALGILAAVLPRRFAIFPVIAAAGFLPTGNTYTLAGLNFTMLRLVIVFTWLGICARSGARSFKWLSLDSGIVLWATIRVLGFTALWMSSAALINALGYAFDELGLYFAFRILLRDVSELRQIIRFVAVMLIPLALLLFVEKVTRRDPFYVLGGVPEIPELRNGTIRCQGPFGHAILAGTFGAVWIPAFLGLGICERSSRRLAAVGVLSSTVITIVSGSSGPVGTYIAGMLGLVMWQMRYRMKAVRWGIVAMLIGLQLVMKEPLWFVFAKIDVFSGSTGWHRANLIDRIVANVGDWWLCGAKDIESWGVYAGDMTNQYVAEGIRAGLLTIVLFVGIIVIAFSYVGKSMRAARGSSKRMQFIFWSLGALLFSHVISFWGVSYFDQNVVNWFLALAMVATAHQHRTPIRSTSVRDQSHYTTADDEDMSRLPVLARSHLRYSEPAHATRPPFLVAEVSGRRTSLTNPFALCVAALLVVTAAPSARAAHIVLIRGTQNDSPEEAQIRQLGEFYGVDVKSLTIGSRNSIASFSSMVTQPGTLGILVAPEALSQLNHEQGVAILQLRSRARTPLLLFGVSDAIDPSILEFWTHGTIRGCTILGEGFHPDSLTVTADVAVTRQLAGLHLAAATSPVCNMMLRADPATETILEVRQGKSKGVPILVRARLESRDVFIVPRQVVLDLPPRQFPSQLPEAFSAMAPFLIFMRYAVGDYGWHLNGHYANLTIDDPWLVQPYGSLDYSQLLVEMQHHNFHTTIAFIPWNFDRSRPDVIPTFRSHPDQYSICIHGNNHTHREFEESSASSLPAQRAAIKQAIARMERFTQLTHIPYDRFMVFPHGIAPEQTLSILNDYGFLGTANALNVPAGTAAPDDATFLLRSYTTRYADLPSLYRYPASGTVPILYIAVHAFLGNPILFYDHASLFASGPTAFNAFADAVNQVQPDTKWASLGEISRHLYFLRRRTGGGFDVLMLSREITIENSSDSAAAFYISPGPGLASPVQLISDGALIDLQSVSTRPILVPAHASRTLRAAGASTVDLRRENVRDRNMSAFVLRTVSDLRDLCLSRSAWGQACIHAYYQDQWDSKERYLERYWWLAGLLLIIVIGGLQYRRTRVHLFPRRTRRDSAR